MTRQPCSGCGSVPPPAARYCPKCARPLPPEPSAAVEAARAAADARRQGDRSSVDDLLHAYDPKPAVPAGPPPPATDAAARSRPAAAADGHDVATSAGAFTDRVAATPMMGAPGVAPATVQSWRACIRMDQQLFPSWIVSTAVTQPGNFARLEATCRGLEFFGDPDGLVGALVVSPRDGARVRVTVDAGDVVRPSVFECALPQSGVAYAIFPKIKYDYEILLESRQQRPVDVTVRVEIEGAQGGEATETCTLRSINDCPFFLALEGPSGPLLHDIGFMFAAYVNENHPWIEGLLKEALQKGIVGSFSAGASPDSIVAQVYAVWSVLRRRGVKYSNITTTPGRAPRIVSQHVRFVDDCVTNAQANCADGSVLLASVLRKIGVEPYLVYVPGHMYLAFAVSEVEQRVGDGTERLTNLFGLETTAIGIPNLQSKPSWLANPQSCGVMRPLPWLGTRVDGPRFEFAPTGAAVSEAGVARHAARDPDDWQNFFAALQIGTENLMSGYVDRETNGPRDIQILRVTDARLAGLMPLAYRPASGATPPLRSPSTLSGNPGAGQQR